MPPVRPCGPLVKSTGTSLLTTLTTCAAAAGTSHSAQWLRSTRAAKADEGSVRTKRCKITHREWAGQRAADRGECTAAHQRTGKVCSRTCTGKTHEVIAEAAPPRAVCREGHPLRHPFGDIAHHVEGAPRRYAIAACAGERQVVAGGVAVRRPVVRPRVRRSVRRHLPLRVRRQPLAGVGARFLCLEPRDVRRGV